MKRQTFRKNLYKWYSTIDRTHPWKSDRDPYKIWLYEIIMQQTRVQQGTPYYERFLRRFPTIKDLAEAKIEQVLKLWEGLGYYSRARNMHQTAVYINDSLGGVFPKSRDQLIKLKGVGAYTAAAIASFAYDEAVDVIDGNVTRVLSRVFGVYEAVDTGAGKKRIEALSKDCLDKKYPANYNQSIMDFGALQCLPKSPLCKSCILAKGCKAKLNKEVHLIPFKSKKLIKKDRFFNYLQIERGQSLLIRQRIEKDIWKLLYELPYIETSEEVELGKRTVKNWLQTQLGYSKSFELTRQDHKQKQVLTHQNIYGSFYNLVLKEELERKPIHYEYCKRDELSAAYAFPKLLDWFLHKKQISLFD